MDFPHLQLASDPHSRLAERRGDQQWLDEQWHDPQTRVLLVAGTRVRPSPHGVEWLSPGQAQQVAPQGHRVLLGETGGRVYFALIIDPAQAPGAKDDWVVLRAIAPQLMADGGAIAPLLFHAMGIAEWLWATRRCPRCGGALTPALAGHELVCAECGRHQFPRTDPAVIMTVVHGEPGSAEERCLLGRQSVWPAGRYSTLAGFCEPGETLEDAVRREVFEEAGIRVGAVDYFGNQPWPLPASLMVGFIGHADTTDVHVDGVELEDARWFTRQELRDGAESGRLLLPSGISISRSLVESWYGSRLPGAW